MPKKNAAGAGRLSVNLITLSRIGTLYNIDGRDDPLPFRATIQIAGVVEQDSLGDLLLAARRGDRQALARVYRLSASSLLAIALRRRRRPWTT